MISKADQGQREQRVLVLSKMPRDSVLVHDVLRRENIPVEACDTVHELCRQIELGAGAVLLTDESIGQDLNDLAGVLERQPDWSDLPLLVLTEGSDTAHELASLTNATLLGRPLRVSTLITAVRTALRARRRQYQIREHVNESHRAEAAIRELNATLERRAAEMDAVIQSMFDAIYIGNRDGISRCNDAALDMLGVSSVEELRVGNEQVATKLDIRYAVSGKPMPAHELPFVEALNGRPSVRDMILRNIRTEQDVYVRSAASPIRQGGRIVGAVAVNSDITERMRAERASRMSERHLRDVLDSLYVFVSVLTPDGTMLQFNRAARDASNLRTEDVVGKPFDELFVWTFSPQVQSRLRNAIRAAARGEPSRYDVTAQIRPGEFIESDFMLAPMFDAQGRVSHLVASGMEITQRVRAERWIASQNAVLQKLAASEPLSDVLCPLVLAVEEQSHGLLGSITLLNPDGKTLSFCCGPSLPEEYNRLVDGFAVGPTAGSCGTAAYRRKAVFVTDIMTDPLWAPYRDVAKRFHLGASWSTPIFATNGKLLGTFALYYREPRSPTAEERRIIDAATHVAALAIEHRRDEEALRHLTATLEQRVSERTAVAEQRAAQLRRLASELTHAEQSERRRLAQVIHDHLQQLLVAARMRANMLNRGVHDPIREDVDNLLHQAIEASRALTFELSPPILYERGLSAALDWLARWTFETHTLTVEVEADPNADPEPHDIRTFLFQAIRELLFNVVKHAGVDRARVIVSRTDDDRCRVVVEDRGGGISRDINNSGGDEQPGFGLSSIRQRIELLDGAAFVESVPGQGTRVTLLAPIHAPPPEPEAPVPTITANLPTPPNEPLKQRDAIRVLLADDQKILREGLVQILRTEADISVVGEADDGEVAIQMAHQIHPDVVVMDVSMSRLNGIDATRRLTREMPEVRVIGLSMHEVQDMAGAMLDAGAVDCLNKSDSGQTLAAAIRRASQPATRAGEGR